MKNNDLEMEKIYQSSSNELSLLVKESKKYEINIPKSEGCVSNLDGWDFLFSFLFGLCGTFITTSDQVADYTNQIHICASGGSGGDLLQRFLGKVFEHKHTWIDIPDGKSFFVNRKGENAYGLFHRLLFGHDVISVKGDNPFALMIKQCGPMKGIINALRHLIADTMSKQGLPFPGSSYFDFINSNGKVSNYLIKLSNSLSMNALDDGKIIQNQQIYSHLATIRFQDIAGAGIIGGSSFLYFKIRGISNTIRETQFRIIAYGVNFFAQAIVGCMKQAGIPYINLMAGSALLKNVTQLLIISNKETALLKEKTEGILCNGRTIFAEIEKSEKEIGSYQGADQFIKELDSGKQNADQLIHIFNSED